jgi:hypothetical protein
MAAGSLCRAWLLGAAGTAAYLGVVAAVAQEPPAKPEGKSGASAVSKEAVGSAIKDWVAKDSKLKGGFFMVWDAETKKPLVLTLEKVHADKLCSLEDNAWFSCAEFKDAEGGSCCLDIVLRGENPKNLAASEVTVHKADGKERYQWKEDGGSWKRDLK